MHTAHPLLSFEIWMRVLFASALFVWLPGHLLIGRWLEGTRPFDRLVCSVALGLGLPFLYAAVFVRAGLSLTPLPYALFVLVLGLASHRWPLTRESGRLWSGIIPRPGSRGSAAVALSMALILLAFLLGHGGLSAPPHVDDASNHAWITLRVVQTGSDDPGILRGDGPGFVDKAYTPGLHVAAALIARAGGLAPYVATWMLVLLLSVLIPASWSLLWRAWGVPGTVVALAVLFASANPLVPGGVFSWGGFGQIAGFFMVPVVAVAMRAAGSAPRLRNAVLAGILTGGLAFLHFSEVFVAAGAVVLFPRRKGRVMPARTLLALSLLLVVFAALTLPELLAVAGHYGSPEVVPRLETKQLGDALERWSRACGRDLLQVLAVVGILVGVWRRASRRIAIATLVLGVWYLALQVRADPVSQWLAHPFYRQAPRILYLQCYLLPPLMAWPVLLLHERLHASRPRLADAVVAGIAFLALGMGLKRVDNDLPAQSRLVPFTEADYHHAVRVGEIVGADEVVANFWRDGSTWAMHVSGRRFLEPASWLCVDGDGRPISDWMLLLTEDPWPRDLVAFLESGAIDWLYVSDTVLGEGPRGLRRRDFDRDDRFELVLAGESSSLYRILRPTGSD